jgi:hypothetical protein
MPEHYKSALKEFYMEINDRACAVLKIGQQIDIFDFGVYSGCEVPDDYDVRSFSVCYKQLRIWLDYIVLDGSGEKVYSSECFIMHERDVLISGIDSATNDDNISYGQVYNKKDIREYRDGNLRALARSLAMDAHRDQKYGNLPYIAHCYQVVSTLKEFGFHNAQIEAVAWLHDVKEDCDVKYDNIILNTFGEPIYNDVLKLTNNGDSRSQKMKNLLSEIMGLYNPTVVKCADRITNIRNSIKNNPKLLDMYISEHADFMQLNLPDSLEVNMMFTYLDKLVWNSSN